MNRPKNQSARNRLLEAAATVYSKKGFRNARIREICELAGANIAAINYYFGDKRRLYEEVLRHAFFGITGADPMAWDHHANADLEQRLRGFVRNLLTQLLSEGRATLYARLVTRELADPTAALERVIEEGIRPQVEGLMSIVRGLMGGHAPERTVRRAAGSVLGQCLYYHFARSAITHLGLEEKLDTSIVEDLTEHITLSALATFDRLVRP